MITRKAIFLAFLLAFLSGCASTDVQKSQGLQGTKAIDFTLPDQNDREVKLSEILKNYRGAVLAFYPKDDSKN